MKFTLPFPTDLAVFSGLLKRFSESVIDPNCFAKSWSGILKFWR